MTSALILLRSRKTGRKKLKAYAIAPANTVKITSVISVRLQLSQKSTPKAIAEVTKPPVNCTNPVPTRLRMPSASLMTRAMSTPIFVESKYATGSRVTCCCTTFRISVIARCAATPNTWDKANAEVA